MIPWDSISRLLIGEAEPQDIHRLWKYRADIELYVETMLKKTASIVIQQAGKRDREQAMIRDAFAVRALELLEIMNESYKNLEPCERKFWKWRYFSELTLEEIGQAAFTPPRDCKDKANYWRVSAWSVLDNIARRLLDECTRLASINHNRQTRRDTEGR